AGTTSAGSSAFRRPSVSRLRQRPQSTSRLKAELQQPVNAGTPATPATRTAPAAPVPAIPVVGIGASAGGLIAFKQFLSAMPADSGAAFILVPHLDPNRPSFMAGLVSRMTSMHVVEAWDGMPLEADRVCVIPPNKYASLCGGVLRLSEPLQSKPTAIDLFLQSLAEERKERAIGIVLSGTG